MRSTPSLRGVIPTNRPNNIGMGSTRLGVVTTIAFSTASGLFSALRRGQLQREPTAVEVGYLNSTSLLGFSRCCLRDAG